MPVPYRHIEEAVRRALDEDMALGDVTTEALFPKPVEAKAAIVANHDAVIAGIAAVREVFRQVDPAIAVIRSVPDGTAVKQRRTVLLARGDARSLLMAERVALNFLQHLSGIASWTARFCSAVRGYRTAVVDTRKTVPGLRALEKWAVQLGGGRSHRRSLGDGILIKDNHLAILRGQGLTVARACRLARERGPHGLRVVVEAESMHQVREALQGEADVVLLDNMSPAQVREAVAVIKGRALIEASGGITLENAREMAAAGADFLSIGALTHSAPAADLSMTITPVATSRRTR